MTSNKLFSFLIYSLIALSVSRAAMSTVTGCWLDSYGRGVGWIPGRPADCPSGYTNMGLTCFKGLATYPAPSRVADCPSGYTNIGLLCHRGFLDLLKSDKMTCPSGYFLNATWGRCYKNCQSGYTNIGEFCTQNLSSLNSDVMTCRADEKKGGIANVRCYPKVGDCGAGGELNGLLCYPKCKSGYNGAGPVCWGKCPSSLPYSCGASCVKDASGCASTIWGQVGSVGQLAATLVTLGTGAAVSAAADAPAKASRADALRRQFDSLKKGYESIKAIPEVKQAFDAADKAAKIASTGYKGAKAISAELELANSDKMTEAEMIQLAAQVTSLVDSTGVSSIVAAYSLPKCSTQFNAPTSGAIAMKKVGYCHPDPANPSWYILKAVDKPGWGSGDLCHATDGSITLYGQKPCKGGGKEECLALESKL